MLKKLPGYYTKIIFVLTSLIFLYLAAFGTFSDMIQRALLITLLCPTVFLTKPFTLGKNKRTYSWTRALDLLLWGAMLSSGIYIMVVWPSRLLKAGGAVNMDIVMGIIMIFCVLECTRRSTGLFVTLTALVFLVYARFGSYFPGIFGHRGETVKRIVTFMYVSTEGVFGMSIGTAATYIILFIIFGAFLEAFGTGQWFVDFAYAITGRYRGGPAKTAIVASGLMGMISGASAANVVTTGSFTIPLMKKMGYAPHEAGAIEAVASTGGMFTPPIMGAGAFLMAEFLQMSYGEIAFAATLPALLFYFSLILVADAVAIKSNLRGVPKDELPKVGTVMRDKGIFVIPIICLVTLIVMGFSPMKSAVFSILCILVVASFKKSTRPTLATVTKALENGSSGVVSIACTCATAGLIVGVLSMTGLGAKLSYSLIAIAQGNLYIGAILAALIAIVLGCGMPPAAVYVILAAVLVNPLVEMGILPLAAHMFIFFFSCIGTITPPVAITAYTGAAIAGADPNKTGFTAFRYGAVAYIVPFIFITSPALIMVGSTVEVIVATITALIGVVCLVAALEGYMLKKVCTHARLLLGIAAIFTLVPGIVTDMAGLGLIAIALIINTAFLKKQSVSKNPM